MIAKPNSLKWIHRLLVIRISILLIHTILTLIYIYSETSWRFIEVVAQLMLNKLGDIDAMEDPAFTTGYLAGSILLPIIFIGLQHFLLKKKLPALFWIIYSIDLLFLISQYKVPLISIAVFILGINQNTKTFLYNKKSKNDEKILDADL